MLRFQDSSLENLLDQGSTGLTKISKPQSPAAGSGILSVRQPVNIIIPTSIPFPTFSTVIIPPETDRPTPSIATPSVVVFTPPGFTGLPQPTAVALSPTPPTTVIIIAVVVGGFILTLGGLCAACVFYQARKRRRGQNTPRNEPSQLEAVQPDTNQRSAVQPNPPFLELREHEPEHGPNLLKVPSNQSIQRTTRGQDSSLALGGSSSGSATHGGSGTSGGA